jgi:DNA-binding LacI/PurR family transcriptional regulator
MTGHIKGDVVSRVDIPNTKAPAPEPARAAGVSHQTVSRVINDHPSVAASTRSLVLTSIRELGFRPNRAARALAKGHVDSIMVLTLNTTLYGYAATLKGIEEEARGNGFAVGIDVLQSASPDEVPAAVHRAVEPGVAVIVIAYDFAGERMLQAIPAGVPVVAAVESPLEPDVLTAPRVWLDDREAARNAVRYLLDLGHPTVHFIELPSSTNTRRRTLGWREALEEAGIEPPTPLVGGWDSASGYRAGRVLAADPNVSAVLCGNDDLAIGVLYAMREAGRAVPHSVSVMGFDDMPQSAFLSPALTTVRLDFVGVGRDCVTLLQGVLDSSFPGAAPVARRCELIVRESTGAYRRDQRERREIHDRAAR